MIRLDKVSYQIETSAGAVQVLRDIDLELPDGSISAIVGPNGSGKTTLARLVSGLLRPTSGNVHLLSNDDIHTAKDVRPGVDVGLVFQNPDNQLVATTVEDDIAFGLENLQLSHAEMVRRVEDVLRLLGLQLFRDYPPHRLSGGQKQKVAIAGVLAMKPSFLILDEATSLLDPTNRREVMQTVLRLNNELGIGIVIVTHLLDEVLVASRVGVLADGVLAAWDSPRAIFSNPAVVKQGDLVLPLSARASFLMQEHWTDFPLCLTPEEFARATCQLT
ncbi:MAG: ATP-binding cassette domain-containing protein [Caldiserica bacterium]|nr:ATP-binding cassette domain-containing protein [Caldisericota bacterium]